MTSGHLVANTDLTLLGDVNFSHLDDAGGQFVADCDGEVLALQLSVEDVVFLQIVDNHLLDEFILVAVVGPFAQLDG